MGVQRDIEMPRTDEEFFAVQWNNLPNEMVLKLLVWSQRQPWWFSVYGGFAVRSTGRGREVLDYLNAHAAELK